MRQFLTLGTGDSWREDGFRTDEAGLDKAPGAVLLALSLLLVISSLLLLFVTFGPFRLLFVTFRDSDLIFGHFCQESHIYSRIFLSASPYQTGLNLTFLKESGRAGIDPIPRQEFHL